MSTTQTEIKAWIAEAKEKACTHLVVACDTYDHGDYPCFVKTSDDVHQVIKDHSRDMQIVMEVYSFVCDHPIESQLREHRARHEKCPQRKKRIEQRGDVLGGAPVFEATRTSVEHIGGLLLAGHKDEVLRDYPHLNEADHETALSYVRSHGVKGRRLDLPIRIRRDDTIDARFVIPNEELGPYIVECLRRGCVVTMRNKPGAPGHLLIETDAESPPPSDGGLW